MNQLHREFLEKIERFLAETGMSATAFGRKTMCDPNFVHRLRTGNSPTLRTVEKLEAFMQENQGARRC